jgi:hypothetical protein
MKNLFIKAVGGLLYIFVAISGLIFLSAWTVNYWQAWTFLAVFMISISAIFIYLARYDPSLLARRIKTAEKKKSQKIIRSLVNLVDPEKVIFRHIEVEYLGLAGLSDRSSRSISASGSK